MRCTKCGRKCREIGVKYTKYIGTQTIYKCINCDEYWVLSWDEFDQTEILSRGDRDLCRKLEAKRRAKEAK